MDPLPGPFEILELAPGASKTLHVLSAVQGTMVIHPSYAPGGKTISALRLFLAPGDKSARPDYYDVTSQTLIAQIAPRLTAAREGQNVLTITKVGSGPAARFTVAWAPAAVA